jgi:hypothetical protein
MDFKAAQQIITAFPGQHLRNRLGDFATHLQCFPIGLLTTGFSKERFRINAIIGPNITAARKNLLTRTLLGFHGFSHVWNIGARTAARRFKVCQLANGEQCESLARQGQQKGASRGWDGGSIALLGIDSQAYSASFLAMQGLGSNNKRYWNTCNTKYCGSQCNGHFPLKGII